MSEVNPASALVKEISGRMRDLLERAEQAIDQLEEWHIQNMTTTVANVLVGAVSHLGLHVGQIQFIAKGILKEQYQPYSAPQGK